MSELEPLERPTGEIKNTQKGQKIVFVCFSESNSGAAPSRRQVQKPPVGFRAILKQANEWEPSRHENPPAGATKNSNINEKVTNP